MKFLTDERKAHKLNAQQVRFGEVLARPKAQFVLRVGRRTVNARESDNDNLAGHLHNPS